MNWLSASAHEPLLHSVCCSAGVPPAAQPNRVAGSCGHCKLLLSLVHRSFLFTARPMPYALCPMQSTEPLVHRNTVLGSSGTLPRSLSTPCSRDLRSYIARTRNKAVRAGDQSRGLGRVSMCARSGLSDVSSTRRCEASTVQRAVSFTPRFANHCCFCCCCV